MTQPDSTKGTGKPDATKGTGKPDFAKFQTDKAGYSEDYSHPDEYQKKLITDRNWDVLIVLTGARVDALEMTLAEENRDKGQGVTSPGGNDTVDWMEAIWGDPDQNWSDVTYVSGEPVWKSDTVDFDLREHVGTVVDTAEGELTKDPDSAWSRYLDTTRPDIVTDIARDEEPPLVVHYRQPYAPFIGDLRVGTVKESHPIFETDAATWTTHGLPQEGHITPDTYRAAYLDNLEAVWEQASKFIGMQDYDVTVTSDHGTLLSGSFTHGNQNDPRSKAVPWFEL